MRACIREIQSTLREVNPLSLEEWETAFNRSRKPAEEVAYWLQISRRYRQALEEIGPTLSCEQRKRCLHAILAQTRG